MVHVSRGGEVVSSEFAFASWRWGAARMDAYRLFGRLEFVAQALHPWSPPARRASTQNKLHKPSIWPHRLCLRRRSAENTRACAAAMSNEAPPRSAGASRLQYGTTPALCRMYPRTWPSSDFWCRSDFRIPWRPHEI